MSGHLRINYSASIAIVLIIMLFVYFAWPPTKISMKSLLKAAIVVARRGGLKVRITRFGPNLDQKSKGETLEGADDPVTMGDLLSHREMFYGLQNTFPSLNIVSEEVDDSSFNDYIEPVDIETFSQVDDLTFDDIYEPVSDVLVWIDPLDATQEYTENLLNYVTTMVCVAVRGRPIMGVIHKPFEDKTLWAWNRGFSISSSLKAEVYKPSSNNGSLQNSKIIVSRSHAGAIYKKVTDAFGTDALVTGAGGAGFKTWEVLRGAQDAYLHITLIKKWDICAGDALLSAVGGKMTNIEGQDIDYSDKNLKKSEKGVLATLHNHAVFVDNVKNIR